MLTSSTSSYASSIRVNPFHTCWLRTQRWFTVPTPHRHFCHQLEPPELCTFRVERPKRNRDPVLALHGVISKNL